MISSRSELARKLSKVKGFVQPKLSLRQYVTPPAIASELLWTAYMNYDLEGRIVFDLGCGTGMLSIGASLLGAEVTGFDIDSEAIKVAVMNAQELGVNIIVFETDIGKVKGFCHTVVMNPPFMVKGGKNDRVFLEKAFSLCERVYSIHTSKTREWVKGFAEENGFEPLLISTRKFSLPHKFKHHEKLRAAQQVDLWFFRKP
ncbi:methyltransferase [archaeon]|nr:methyltransferase [archaeon]